MKNSKISQGTIEFVIITTSIVFFFTLFFLVIQNNLELKGKEREEIVVKNLALYIQNEIEIAKKASNGYMRSFEIPEEIEGKEYGAQIIDGLVYVNTTRTALSIVVGNVSGDIQKGENIIKKENENVYLNQ